MTLDGLMLDIWAAMDKQSTHLTSTHPCLIIAADIQGVKYKGASIVNIGHHPH
jgi:hypothetical protein